MDVWGITVATLRRWYVFLPLLVLTGVGTVLVGEGVQPEYEVDATAVLVPGSGGEDVEGPYGGRENTSQVLAIVLDSDAVRDSVEEQGLERDYTIETEERTSILRMEVLSGSRDRSLATLETVLERTEQELAERQDAAGLPAYAQIKMQVLQRPSVSEVVTTGKMRNMAIVGVVGAGLSLLIALLFDDLVGIFKRRVRRGRETPAPTWSSLDATVRHDEPATSRSRSRT